MQDSLLKIQHTTLHIKTLRLQYVNTIVRRKISILPSISDISLQCIKNQQRSRYVAIHKNIKHRCGSRIWSRGGPQVLRPKVADVAKRSCASEASNLRPGSRARLRALEAFGFLMLKYAFSHILETLFL